jgi:sRNA-binding protein
MTSDPTAPDEPAVPAGPAATVAVVPAVPSVDAPASPDAPGARTPELSPAACGARLAELFPALFVPQGAPGPLKPIKLRIQADIQVRAPGLFSKRVLGIFFSRYTTSTAYLKALVNAPHRFDLDGQPAGEIAGEHRQAAGEELARRRELHQARHAAEREAQWQAQHAARAAEDAARRERANLLRAFETTTLTRANFCALKGLTDAALESALEVAWHERNAMPARPPAAEARAPHAAPRPGPSDRPTGPRRPPRERA